MESGVRALGVSYTEPSEEEVMAYSCGTEEETEAQRFEVTSHAA